MLFNPTLTNGLLGLAADTGDEVAFDAVEALVVGGRCRPRLALECALRVLTAHRSVRAGELLATLKGELLSSDVPAVLDQVIALASSTDIGVFEQPWTPRPLVALAEVHLEVVTARIVEFLEDDADWTRHVGADAAKALLLADPARVVALGTPLAKSIRGEDAHYAGYPHPSGNAVAALAAAWLGVPGTTRQIVELAALSADHIVRGQLARIPWQLGPRRRSGEPDSAITAAIDFMVQRAGGDWGDAAADHSADHLCMLARTSPELIVDHANALIGYILSLCAPDGALQLAVPTGGIAERLEAESRRMTRSARRRDLVKTVGRCSAVRPDVVLALVLELFSSSTGTPEVDRVVRTTMLKGLEEAATPNTIRDLLPVMYSALLSDEVSIRSQGIDLWERCARVMETLPDELAELSKTLLADPKVVVHRVMLDRLPRLRLPHRLAPELILIAAGWLHPYRDNPDVLEDAIWAVRYLSNHLESEEQTRLYQHLALSYLVGCRAHGRERLLLAEWSEGIRDDPLWITLAVRTVADPDSIDYYNARHEPLLAELFDQPRRIAGIPIEEVGALSEVHGHSYTWRALEVVELLQSAERWSEASVIASDVETRQRPGAEGRPQRLLAAAVSRGAEMARILTEVDISALDVAALVLPVYDAVAELESDDPEWVSKGPTRWLLCGLKSAARVAQVLLDPWSADPAAQAIILEEAAEEVGSAPGAHASGTQREWVVRCWVIAAFLMRYDQAVRDADPVSAILLDAARRRAEGLASELVGSDVPVSPFLEEFLALVAACSNAGAAEASCRVLGRLSAPVWLVGTSLLPSFPGRPTPAGESAEPEESLAVCVITLKGVPVTDVLVVEPNEVTSLGLSVRLSGLPDWVTSCTVEPITTLSREALSVPEWKFAVEKDSSGDLLLSTEGQLHCAVETPVLDPAIDCPLVVRVFGDGREEMIEAAGCRRLKVRPFDPARDHLTEHRQTDARLLEMYDALDSPEFDTEDARALCRLFSSCVRAAQGIMFEKVFMRGTKVSEAQFHDELEKRLLEDPDLGGRVSRRDRVAGGWDDLLHDDVVAELKVWTGAPLTIPSCAKFLGQPSQYGVGRGSQLSTLIVLDHSRKEAPPGVIENYIDWLRPKLHGLDDPRYPTLVAVIIVNTNLPIPSAWSRKRIEIEVGPEVPEREGEAPA
jgi:hypothetical protein